MAQFFKERKKNVLNVDVKERDVKERKNER